MTEDLFDVIGGAYAADLLLLLHETGNLNVLREPTQVSELAANLPADPDALHGALAFLAATTSIVLSLDDGRFQLACAYRDYNGLGFHLDKFLRAYGPTVRAFGRPASESAGQEASVDRTALADAFSRRTSRPPTLSAQILHAWSVTALIDLGCGPGSLLLELARADPEFTGWGIDASPAMITAAQARAVEAGVADRIRFSVGDVREVTSIMPSEGSSAASVHARSLLNEFFAAGQSRAVEILATIRGRFANQLIFIEDYYGRLGTRTAADFRHTRLQDLVQLTSGQGVPPSHFEGWGMMYAAAGCSLLHRYEGIDDGIAWFIHVCLLGSESAPRSP